ncbi:cyclin Dx [Periophthalmus magnuspinnatus]|uniref:cyclin Dx n=1 Tax=Periophthalmus magnuspinnatus TaxID=409849 RepID=UPI00145A6621|nr:cyclin Dx [Periophthalmus magnuspinnatus]
MSQELAVSLWCEEAGDAHSLEEDHTESRVLVEIPVQTRDSPVEIQEQNQERCDVPAAWDPSVLGQRAVTRLLQLERRYLPSALYVSLIQGAPESRDELVKWAMEVCSDAGCEEQVFPLSVSLLDRFLSSSLSVPASPFCLVASCVLVASKLTECETLPVDTLCAAAEYSFSSHSLREMERVLVGTLSWDLASVTPQDFLPHFLSAAVTSSSRDGSDLASTVRRHSDTLSALCVCDPRFLGAPPSLLAAGALCCALKGLGTNQHLELTTERIAHLCQTDPAVLQYFSEMIELVLRERLSGGLQSAPSQKEEELTEPPRPGTPADMTEIDF